MVSRFALKLTLEKLNQGRKQSFPQCSRRDGEREKEGREEILSKHVVIVEQISSTLLPASIFPPAGADRAPVLFLSHVSRFSSFLLEGRVRQQRVFPHKNKCNCTCRSFRKFRTSQQTTATIFSLTRVLSLQITLKCATDASLCVATPPRANAHARCAGTTTSRCRCISTCSNSRNLNSSSNNNINNRLSSSRQPTTSCDTATNRGNTTEAVCMTTTSKQHGSEK